MIKKKKSTSVFYPAGVLLSVSSQCKLSDPLWIVSAPCGSSSLGVFAIQCDPGEHGIQVWAAWSSWTAASVATCGLTRSRPRSSATDTGPGGRHSPSGWICSDRNKVIHHSYRRRTHTFTYWCILQWVSSKLRYLEHLDYCRTAIYFESFVLGSSNENDSIETDRKSTTFS